MKRMYSTILLLASLAPALTACGGYDYSPHVSEARCDLFVAETEEFNITLSCVLREYPYVSDGITCPQSMVAESPSNRRNTH